MPMYLTRFSYTPETWTRLIANPEDRRKAADRPTSSPWAGSCTGSGTRSVRYDGVNLWEAPDNVSMAAVALAIGSGGALASIETTVLLTVEETMEALGKAQGIGYRPPGATRSARRGRRPPRAAVAASSRAGSGRAPPSNRAASPTSAGAIDRSSSSTTPAVSADRNRAGPPSQSTCSSPRSASRSRARGRSTSSSPQTSTLDAGVGHRLPASGSAAAQVTRMVGGAASRCQPPGPATPGGRRRRSAGSAGGRSPRAAGRRRSRQ